MSLNLVNAFTYVFKEKNWFVKILIGSILIFFIKVIGLATDVFFSDALPKLGVELFLKDNFVTNSILVLLYFGAFALTVLAIWMHATAFGYIMTTIRRYMRNQEDSVPDWDEVMGKLFKRGLKALLATFVLVAAFYVFGTTIFFAAFAMAMFSPFAAMITGLVGLFILTYAIILTPGLVMSYCEKDRFLAAFDFVRSRQFLLKSPLNYVLMMFMLVVVAVIQGIIIAFLLQAKVGILVLPILSFYIFIVFGNIIGQYYVQYCKE